MLKEGATISTSRLWILRFVGVSICVWSIFELMVAFQGSHFELGASRRHHLVFDLKYGYAHYAAGIMMLIAASGLGMMLTLLQVFTSEVGQRRYRLACKVVGGISMATIVLAYLAQLWRF